MVRQGFHKFLNKTFTNEYGKWDSKLEWNRFCYLMDLQDAGIIDGLTRQKVYELLPKQTKLVDVQLKTKTKKKEIVVEKPVTYKADFFYYKIEGDNSWIPVVEDTKSEITRRNPEYIIKRKLMLFQGNPIVEITNPTQPI